MERCWAYVSMLKDPQAWSCPGGGPWFDPPPSHTTSSSAKLRSVPCPPILNPRGEGGNGRGLFFAAHKGLSLDLQKTNPSPPRHTLFFWSAWMKLNWFAQTKAAIHGVSDYTQTHIFKTSNKKKVHCRPTETNGAMIYLGLWRFCDRTQLLYEVITALSTSLDRIEN